SGSQYNVLYDRLADDQGNPLSIGGWNRFRQSYIDTAGNGLLKDWNYRPLQELGMNTFRNDDLSYQVNTTLRVRPFDWLTLSVRYRYAAGNGNLYSVWSEEAFQMRNMFNQFSTIDRMTNIVTTAIPSGGQLNTTRHASDHHNARIQADLNHSWGRHKMAVLGGAEVNSLSGLSEIDATRLGYQSGTETFTPIDLTGRYPQYHLSSLGTLSVAPIQPTRDRSVNRNVLLFGNASYTYSDRYTATISVRKDEANIFGVEANRRGKPFWSSGLLWHIHEEDFARVPWLQRLSLRGTHGMMGNVSTASAYLTSMGAFTPYFYTDRVYQSISTPPNPMLSWEKVQMTNVAVDFALWQGGLSGSVERYFRKSTDLLSYNPMAPSSGVSQLYGNWSS
ncbi:hypothetical protein G5B35_24755, partial [Parapusillimonas sp. SGNA-6]|nr:hypothetical protein [Parapusillimonas sp. SGNA-6]